MGCAHGTHVSHEHVGICRKDKEYLAQHPAIEQLREGGVVVLAGAGISCSAGIPDFRSKGTGLYDNLKQYNLPDPAAIFNYEYFRQHPQAFTKLAKELWPSNFCPTPAHCFVRLLQDKGLLHRHYTQNVDGLDRKVGIHEDKLVEAHGSFGAGHCIDCRAAYTEEHIRKELFKGEIVKCTKCGGLVKPDITFFGEPLPKKFSDQALPDMKSAKVVLCMGTSLSVQPFANLAKERNSPEAKRILVNRVVPSSYKQRKDNLVLLGECDDQIWELARALGWEQELEKLCNEHGRELEWKSELEAKYGENLQYANI